MIKKRFISMLVLLMTAVTGAWATITVTWNNNDITGSGNSFTKDGVTITAGKIDFNQKNFTGGGTFTTTLGNFTKIEVTTGEFFASGTGWSGSMQSATWTGTPASSVSFSGAIMGMGGMMGPTKFVFTIEPATVAVTGVTLAPTSATLTLGETETVTLTATVFPGDATDKSVTWSSSNEAVATVTDGVVTAVAAGEATITVTTTDGAKTATCAVTVAAPAPATYTVTLKEGTEDATSWTIAPAEATTTGVAAGTEVKATYGGTKKVKSVKAVKKAAASLIVNPVVGQIIGSDGKNYDANATLPDGVTAVAMIAYVGSETGVDGYTHGLALALTDKGQMNWSTATGASGAAAHTPAAPTPITSSWMLPSKDQWTNMITAAGGYAALRDGFSGISGASNLQSDIYSCFYWSSTEDDSGKVWFYYFVADDSWYLDSKDYDYIWVRACLAF